MDWDEQRPQPRAAIAVGDDLKRLGLAELDARIAALEAEIARTKSEIAAKKAHSASANALFKSS